MKVRSSRPSSPAPGHAAKQVGLQRERVSVSTGSSQCDLVDACSPSSVPDASESTTRSRFRFFLSWLQSSNARQLAAPGPVSITVKRTAEVDVVASYRHRCRRLELLADLKELDWVNIHHNALKRSNKLTIRRWNLDRDRSRSSGSRGRRRDVAHRRVFVVRVRACP